MSVREEDVIALRNEIHRLEMLVEGMAEAAEEITRERDELRSVLAGALDLLARTEDAYWNADVKGFLTENGYVERSASRYSLDGRAFMPAMRDTPA